MVRYQKILESYFTKLKDFYLNDATLQLATAELSFRPFLDEFFVNVISYIDPTIARIFEPCAQGKYGRPDWVFTDTQSMGIYGYVEAKGIVPDAEINVSEYQDQVSKYLNLGNPVLLTDGIQFLYFSVDGNIETFSLFNKPLSWENPQFNLDSFSYFQKFFSKVGFRTIPENLIITELSKRTKSLCLELTELLQLEEDETETETELVTLRTLKRLWDTAARNLDISLSDNKTFAGFISQILAFGLLYAHRFINDSYATPAQNYERLHIFWTTAPYARYAKHVEPFVHLFKALSDELNSKLSKIGGWYDNTRRLLSHVKLSKTALEKPNFHKLYEDFLAEYDRDTRVDYGAWYTPIFLSDFMAKFIDFLLHVNPELKALNSNPFHVIDPCCGTGTILESVLDHISLPENSVVVGFEILPVPYALANYRLSLYEVSEDFNSAVLLTNTLGNNTFIKPQYNLGALDSVGLFFAKEQVASYKLSQPPLTIVIGNPPCSDSSVTNSGKYLEQLMEDFRPPIRTGRQNIQMQLKNEWIKFLRWALYKAMDSRPAVIAMILPSTFAANISFKYARKFLTGNADEISVIEFDSDNRVESANQNIFNTLQGRLMMIASFTQEGPVKFVRYKDIRNMTRAEKINFFSQPIQNMDWEALPINEDYSLRPIGEYNEALYSNFVLVTAPGDGQEGIFLRHCSGMKLAPTHLLVHFSKGQLSRRARYIADSNHTYQEIKDRWYSGQAKPPSESKITQEVRNRLSQSARCSSRYSYRPFLEAYVNDDVNLLSSLTEAGGKGMRFRPEVKAAFSNQDVVGFALAPAPAEISREIDKFCSFCWHMPDNDLSTRGNAHIFCNRFPAYKNKKTWTPKVQSNVNSNLLEILAQIHNDDVSKLETKIVYYVYAILSSPFFLETFAAKLHAVAGQWPAVPVVEDIALFNKIAKVGIRLAELEKTEYNFSDEENSQLSSFDWQANLESFELKKYEIGADFVKFITSDGNEAIYNAPSDILNFSVSGYNVVREWLKYHSYAYYRKNLSIEDINDFTRLIKRLHLYLMEYPTLDDLVNQSLSANLIKLK